MTPDTLFTRTGAHGAALAAGLTRDPGHAVLLLEVALDGVRENTNAAVHMMAECLADPIKLSQQKTGQT